MSIEPPMRLGLLMLLSKVYGCISQVQAPRQFERYTHV